MRRARVQWINPLLFVHVCNSKIFKSLHGCQENWTKIMRCVLPMWKKKPKLDGLIYDHPLWHHQRRVHQRLVNFSVTQLDFKTWSFESICWCEKNYSLYEIGKKTYSKIYYQSLVAHAMKQKFKVGETGGSWTQSTLRRIWGTKYVHNHSVPPFDSMCTLYHSGMIHMWFVVHSAP